MSAKEIKRVRSTATPNLIAALVLLLVANLFTAVVLIHRAHKNLNEQIGKRMLDIGNTAADMLDPEFMKRMELADIGSEDYEKAIQTLRIFQENIDLSYIYAVRRLGDGSFVFTIDPDPKDPAPFGFPLEWEEELVSASNGIPAIEKEPHSDKWGTFYTAFTPIFDQDKNVVGIIGVDYDAGMYGSHLAKDILIIILIIGTMLLIGTVMAVLIARQNRRRYAIFDQELNALYDGFEQLNKAMMESSAVKLQERPQTVGNDLLKALAAGSVYDDGPHKRNADEFTDVSTRLQQMQDAMKHYIAYLDSQTYVDGMTGVGNKAAYQRELNALAVDIKAGKAQFAVGFFDINEMRVINSNYGFEVGDAMLYATATILKRVFHEKNVYRVASDEFIVIMHGKTLTDMDEYFAKFNEEVDLFNRLKKVPATLAVSKGSAVHRKDQTENYRWVFLQAEAGQLRDKAAYYAAKDQLYVQKCSAQVPAE